MGSQSPVTNRPTACVIDYTVGNIFSIQQACKHVGFDVVVSSDHDLIQNSDCVILPGVGAFPHAMKKLISQGIVDALDNFRATGKPLIGICLGMQLLFDKSSEFEECKGLGYIPGEVIHLNNLFDRNGMQSDRPSIPHTGWAQVYPAKEFRSKNIGRRLIWEATENKEMYFVHSFVAYPKDSEDILTYSSYGGLEFCSSVQKDNVFGFQFHPEKSGQNGLLLCQKLNSIIKHNQEI